MILVQSILVQPVLVMIECYINQIQRLGLILSPIWTVEDKPVDLDVTEKRDTEKLDF